MRRVSVAVFAIRMGKHKGSHAAWFLGITAGVLSGTAAFSVKKRRLFERSEFRSHTEQDER